MSETSEPYAADQVAGDQIIDLLLPDEVATLLRVSRRTVERWAYAGLLPAFKVAERTIRFHRADVVAFVRANTRTLGPADRNDGPEDVEDG